MKQATGRLLARMIRQAVVIAVLAAAAGLVFNLARPTGLPLAGPIPGLEPRDGVIGLERAQELFAGGQALFIDARSQLEYETGHIRGALSLPAEEFDDIFPAVEETLAQGKPLVAYCHGQACPLSTEVADRLRSFGFGQVAVFQDGWGQWTKAGLPVTRGPAP